MTVPEPPAASARSRRTAAAVREVGQSVTEATADSLIGDPAAAVERFEAARRGQSPPVFDGRFRASTMASRKPVPS